MIDPLNIATMPIADKVHRHMLASYYALQLDALQAEARRLGYSFSPKPTWRQPCRQCWPIASLGP